MSALDELRALLLRCRLDGSAFGSLSTDLLETIVEHVEAQAERIEFLRELVAAACACDERKPDDLDPCGACQALRLDDFRAGRLARPRPGDGEDVLAHLIVLSHDEDARGGFPATWAAPDGSMVDLWIPAGLLAAVEQARRDRKRGEANVTLFREAYFKLREERS